MALLFPLRAAKDPAVTNNETLFAICAKLRGQIENAVASLKYRRNPRAAHRGILDSRNPRRVGLRRSVSGMIGVKSKDFFLIPYALARLNVYDNYLLTQATAHIQSYVASRLPIRCLEVLLAADGLDYFAIACASGALSKCRFKEIHKPVSLSRLPLPICIELSSGRTYCPKDDREEALATSVVLDGVVDRCLTVRLVRRK